MTVMSYLKEKKRCAKFMTSDNISRNASEPGQELVTQLCVVQPYIE